MAAWQRASFNFAVLQQSCAVELLARCGRAQRCCECGVSVHYDAFGLDDYAAPDAGTQRSAQAQQELFVAFAFGTVSEQKLSSMLMLYLRA